MTTVKEKTDYRFRTHGMTPSSALPNVSGKLKTYKGAYISITNKCNTDVCEYCYARAEDKKEPMSLENFLTAVNWLDEISDFPEVYFVGGEPSTHPKFIDFLDILGARGWGSTLYTNGAFDRNRCHKFASHPGLLRVAFHYEDVFFEQFANYRERLLYNMEVLGREKEGSLIFIISDRDFQYEEQLHLAKTYNLAITWIFAAPTSGNTPYIGLKSMKEWGPRLQQFLIECHEAGISTSPDLPVPLCVFDEEFRDKYTETFSLVRRCRPFVYFKSDLSTQFCTALPAFSSERPADSQGLLETIKGYREVDTQLKKKISFPECEDCEHHVKNICQGGCMSYKTYATPEKMI
jgi:hypothetical protein